MFYVSGISGTLIPFDPRTTPISSAVQPILPVSEVSSATEGAFAGTPALKTEEAAIYDGPVPPSTRDMSGAKEALNIARAGAALAYRIQEAEHSADVTKPEENGAIESIQQSRSVDEDQHSPHRVDPIKRSKYQIQTPEKSRKKVVAAIDIMSAPVLTLNENSSLEEARSIFKMHRFRHIPILSSAGKLVGIVSDRDFLGMNPQNVSKDATIKAHMVTNILTARPLTEIRAIAEVLITHRIGCLPIVDENESLVGILTRSDILRAIVNHAPIELWT